MARIVFMGTPEFAVPSLTALTDAHQVVGVVTQPDRPAGRGLPVFQPRSLRTPEALAHSQCTLTSLPW